MDRRLRWDVHIQSISKKMATQVYALDRIAGSTWGASLQRARQVYTAVVWSAIGYRASEWHRQISKNRAKALNDVQTECLRKVTGAFKATATTVLETEAYVSPLDTWLNRRVAASEERLQQPRIASLIQARYENAARWILTRPTRRRRPKGPDTPDRKRWLDE